MANFKASSSRLVFGTVLLLLLVVINYVYHPAAAAASCSNSSEVMLFKSSPLKVVEEVAKDQRTTTEIAIDDHHEIQAGRVLQGVGDQVWKLLNKFKSPLEGKKPAYKTYEEAKNKIDLIRDIPDYVEGLKKYLDENFCDLQYCYPSAEPNHCGCQEKKDPTKTAGPCLNLTPIFYCCQGIDATCSDCCQGKDGNRDILNITRSSSSTTPTTPTGVSSSQSPTIAYVAMAVISSLILV